MISAGNNYPTAPGYGPPPGYGMAPPAGPSFATPAQLQYMPMSQPNLNITMDSSKVPDNYLKWQTGLQGGAMLSNLGTTIANYYIAKKSMEAQAKIAVKYYETQDNIASYQKDVAIKQLEVQDSALFVQKDMHFTQTRHEENMARLEGHTQARLARITEDGRSERARILSMTDAFSRRGWGMGAPLTA